MRIRVVWLIKPRFEREWLWTLLSSNDWEIEELAGEASEPSEPMDLYPSNTIFIINATIDYEIYFARYEAAGVPYAVIHLSDEYYRDSYKFYDHSTCLWIARNYWHPELSMRPKVITFGLGWKNGLQAALAALPTASREYAVSFAGNIHHEFRRNFVQAFADIKPNKFHLTYDGFDSKSGLDIESYAALMKQSKYVLCPIGHCNIDSFRVYEALEAGAIPITISITSMQRWLYWDQLFDAPVPWISVPSIQYAHDELSKKLESSADVKAQAQTVADMWKATKKKWVAAFHARIYEMML